MMKKNRIQTGLLLVALTVTTGFSSCSLDEYNPGGYTYETVAASSVEGYISILNNIYFGMERRMYGHPDWMRLTEAGTDLWTYNSNGTGNSSWFRYAMGETFSDVMKDVLNPIYDGIGSCNMAIKMAELAPFTSEEQKNALMAEAYFMRGMYYYNLVEQMGGVTVVLEPASTVDLHPEKTAPLAVYQQVIIPDLEFAAQWLPVEERTTRPSKKSAMGFLLRAYLQTVQYDNTKAYAQKALSLAKDMILDLEAGGAKYGIRMYPTFEEVFDEVNNWDNTEALWKHRFVAGGNSNNGWVLNENVELFYCTTTTFPARKFNKNEFNSNGLYAGGKYDGLFDRQIWGWRSGGQFMPTQHLLSLFLQDDGTLDPRYHKSFQTFWDCNNESTWNTDRITRFDRTADIVAPDPAAGILGTKVSFNDPALEFIMPGDEGYAAASAARFAQPYMVVDYKDVYDDETKRVKMKYLRVNRPTEDGDSVTNPFYSFYPSLMKHNSTKYHFVRNDRVGNLNATFMMRSPEIYLLAAEADIYANGGADAIGYINKVRTRAGANPLTGSATVELVLDERARELCGEYVRWYDLKRTGMLSSAYLKAKNPDVGDYFREHHKVRPFSPAFLNTIQDGGVYYQNPGY